LRKTVDATRERVKALEAEVHAPRGRGVAGSTNKPTYQQAVTEYYGKLRYEASKASDPLAEAEAALKALREARDAEAQRRAADNLEKALQRLKEQPKPNKTTGDHTPRP